MPPRERARAPSSGAVLGVCRPSHGKTADGHRCFSSHERKSLERNRQDTVVPGVVYGGKGQPTQSTTGSVPSGAKLW